MRRVVFAFNGGGIRGLIQARVLMEIWRLAGLQGQGMAGSVDMLAGTSTGGIMACGLAKFNPKTLYDFYRSKGPSIFKRELMRRGPLLAARAKYSGAALRRALEDVLGACWFSRLPGNVLVTSYSMLKAAPNIFKNWRCAENACRDFQVVDVCMATSAAPTYFPPARISPLTGPEQYHWDGGVYVNNPSMCAYAEAKRLWPEDDVFLVWFGTGAAGDGQIADAYDVEGMRVAVPLMNVMMDASQDVVAYQCRQILGDNFVEVQPQLWAGAAMDDASPRAMSQLEAAAELWIESHEDVLEYICEALRP